ncbi:HAMP domain-containing sensor histidine kinase [Leifsonia bigeumensis]|uniref:histidine kinase n=1 Tax=Leifsonella bigeumensis TaxID=433643 RepID=A0ABP7FW79_9MICO
MTLRSRLVWGIVALLAILSIVIGAVSVLVLRQALTARLDSQLDSAMHRVETFLPRYQMTDPDRAPGIGDAQGAGTLGLIVRDGVILGPQYFDENARLQTLTAGQQRSLVGIRSAAPVTIDLGGMLGSYRVVTARTVFGDQLIVGLPMREVDATTWQLTGIVGVVALAGLGVAGLVGTLFVRFALRPLAGVVATATRVSELTLDRGEVALAERVPDADTDSSTEVGRVGAALNRMLEHVAAALSARQASENRVRQFVADASHELRTPLASIRGYSELTRRGGHALPKDITTALSRIESESVRMTALVEELLLLARLDEGSELRAEPVALVPLVADAVSDARVSSPDHDWVLQGDDQEAVVTGDPARLQQSVSNLLANARIHTPKGTTVTTTVAHRGGQVVVTVADDGPGVPPELLPNLFERFVRGDGSRSRVAGSTGLGLAIARAIVEAHGGSIEVTSEPGDTRFSIALPLVPVSVP